MHLQNQTWGDFLILAKQSERKMEFSCLRVFSTRFFIGGLESDANLTGTMP